VNASDNLNAKHWNKIMEAEQATVDSDKSVRARTLQRIAVDARNDIRKYRAELAMLAVPNDVEAAKAKSATVLDNWDNFFYYMAKYAGSGSVDDFGEATRHYKAVELGISETNALLGVAPAAKEQPPPHEEPYRLQPEGPHPAKEREIIREKEVIVKIRCPYCNGAYDETLNECPHCGARR
jgi:hypothetical protein